MAFLELIIAARSKASMLTTSTPRSLRSSPGALWQRNRSSTRCKPLQPQAGAFARRPYLHAGHEYDLALPYFLAVSARDQPAVEAVSNLDGKFTDTRFASPHSNITTRAPVHPHHTPARNADFSDPRTCLFQGGSTRPASVMEFLRKSSCSSTSQASTGPLLLSYLPRALTSIPACSGYDVGFLLCAGGLLLS